MIATITLFAAIVWNKLVTAWHWRFGFAAKLQTIEEERRDWFRQFDITNGQNAQLKERNDYLESLIMKLRVYQMDEGIRTGFAVTAFIPSDVLAHLKNNLPAERVALRNRVAEVLVERALRGLWNLQGVDQKVTALVFEPLGNTAQCTTWREGDKRPSHIAPMIEDEKAKALREVHQIRADAARLVALAEKANLPREAESEL